MGKQITVFVLLLAVLGQAFNRAAIVTSYYTNTGAYAKSCENKAKPMMHCNGKCQMMKKMKQEENKDKQDPGRRNSADDVLSCKSFFTSLVAVPVPGLDHACCYIPCFPTERSAEFFHPPGA